MNDLTPLPVYPRKPSGDVLERVKQAKAQLNTSKLITLENAVPGSPGRILAIGEKPNFICEYAFVKEPTVESLRQALSWCLGLTEDSRGVTVIKILREVFGEGVVEIGSDSN